MKEDIFNQYVEKILDLFNISREDLFLKSKKRHLVDARQLLYFLCYERQMRMTYIQSFLLKNGCDAPHTSIIHGIKVTRARVEEDKDYQSIIKDIDKSVFI
jgi:chromosomal replication initiation ATPase DnaA